MDKSQSPSAIYRPSLRVQRVKVRHLLTFVEIARLESVAGAAEWIGVTQPAVSKTLHELEETLGAKLFDRTYRKVVLTSAGKTFLQYAVSSLNTLHRGVDSIVQAQTSHNVRVTVGSLPLVSSRILPGAVSLFTQEALASRIEIITGPHSFLMSQLRNGELDFVFGRMGEPETMKGFSFEHLYSEELALVVRQGHPLAGQPFDLTKIIEFPVLIPPAGAAIRPIVDRFLISHGIDDIRDQIESVSISFCRSYVTSSNAIWIISASVIANDVAEKQLTFLPIDMSETLGPIGVMCRTTDDLSIQARLLIGCIRRISSANFVGEIAKDKAQNTDGSRASSN